MLGRFIFPLTFLRRGKIKLLYSNLQKESYTTSLKDFHGHIIVQGAFSPKLETLDQLCIVGLRAKCRDKIAEGF
jgi:hypothetical protein